MAKGLDEIILRLRNELGLTQEQLSRGICSMSALSRIENGEKDPEKIVFDGLISRLGKDCKKWDFILEEQDKLLFYHRNRIEYLLRVQNWEVLEEEVKQYEKNVKQNKNLHTQYLCWIWATVHLEKGEYEQAWLQCKKGLKETDIRFNEKTLTFNSILSSTELSLLYIIGELLYLEKKVPIPRVYEYWKKLLQHVKLKCTDWEYQFPYYIKAQYYLAKILFEQGKEKQSLLYIKEIINKLKAKKSIYYLKETLQFIVERNEKVSFLSYFIEKKKQVIEILEEWDRKNKEYKEHIPPIKPYTSAYSIGEIIRNVREVLKISQEELLQVVNDIKEIGTQAGLSEIENCKRKPRKETAMCYLYALGIGDKVEIFSLTLKEDDFSLQELQCEIDFCISNHEKERAEELLFELKDRVDMKNIYNQQYIKQVEYLINTHNEEYENYTYEQHIQKIMDILSLTMPELENGNPEEIKLGFLIREELILVINIGCSYQRGGEFKEALEYYKKIEWYLKEAYQFSSGKLYKVLLHNMTQVNGMLGNYDEAIKRAKDSIFMDWLYYEGYIYYQSLYNLGWCYGSMAYEGKDKQKKTQYQTHCDKFFQQAYLLSLIYDDNMIDKAIKNIRNKWDK